MRKSSRYAQTCLTGDVYDALLSVAEDESLNGACGAKTRCEARGITAKIKTYPFMYS